MDITAITYSLFIPLLNSIHELTSGIGLVSFGWAIVFLTAGVKLVLTPLTYKQIKSTRKMQQIQPQMKKQQDDFKKTEEKLKNDPAKLQTARAEFQQKMMSFYKDNDVNPLGGCLPLLVQMPILLGLFWTFSGPPFKSQPIFVDVKVVSAAEANKKQIKYYDKGEIYVDSEGRRARIMLNAKKITMLEGENYTLKATKAMGDAQLDPAAIKWGFFNGVKDNDFVNLEANTDGSAVITAKTAGGSAKLEAKLPQSLKNDSFFFIKDFGDTGVFNKKTGTLNIDILILVALFGISIWLSSKLNAPKLAETKPGETEDPQVAMQKSMATMMPIMMTGMMLIIPLPAGALLYMIVSGFIQAGQTYFAMKRYDK
ncbi:MAG: membrane protein insertase YidC [Cyanobacteria bacterium]|nr:membrane protein insertase YidC [Cyanobacteriota bacterium]